jgi:hypothetical protein
MQAEYEIDTGSRACTISLHGASFASQPTDLKQHGVRNAKVHNTSSGSYMSHTELHVLSKCRKSRNWVFDPGKTRLATVPANLELILRASDA